MASTKVLAIAAHDAKGVCKKFAVERRSPGPNDVAINIAYCGICHSDLHQLKNEWHGSVFPIVPGHEIVGTVSAVGAQVTKFKLGDKVGVGCFVDSCRKCDHCRVGDEQYCSGCTFTYNTVKPDGEVTYGGYSKSIVVDENYVLRIPDNLDLAGAAPLLCAGITVYSPFVHFGITSRHRVGVLGLGGLGHMAVKILHAMGCEVVVLSTSPGKESLSRELGADKFIVTSKPEELAANAGTLDFIIDTVSAKHSLEPYFGLCKTNASVCLVGVPPEPFNLGAGSLIFKRLKLGGSLIGGIRETQECLDLCGRHNVTALVEVISADYVNKALERLEKNDVKFRFVIDLSTLTDSSPEVADA